MDANLEPCTPETPDEGLGISDPGFVFTTCDSPVDQRELLFKFLIVGEFGVGKFLSFLFDAHFIYFRKPYTFCFYKYKFTLEAKSVDAFFCIQ